MFHDLFSGHLQLFHLNFGTITLFTKKEAVRIEQFRPICLLNVSFKYIFAKSNSMPSVAHVLAGGMRNDVCFQFDHRFLIYRHYTVMALWLHPCMWSFF